MELSVGDGVGRSTDGMVMVILDPQSFDMQRNRLILAVCIAAMQKCNTSACHCEMDV